ncbi:TonB-dependent receptor domain-containing protein [Sphingomonas sp.]|uniref:TonB-dependent receptor n=1 Tax=Sphingomonas sp. TaxID=28214 RepID=UPI00286E2027|nr:TonB-dependent receptor [Sphingomonas sp.]
MAKSTSNRKPAFGLHIALLATSLLTAMPAHAQLTTSTIRGHITNATAAVPGATVTAVNVDNGATTRAQAGADGSYVLTGLRPGTYDISFAAAGGTPITRRVIIEVGQTASLDVDTAAPAVPPEGTVDAGDAPTAGGAATSDEGTIVVTGTRLIETRTSEVGTNVSNQQIENLPQNNRNFLNFAQLAPGIRVNQTDQRQTFSGGGVGAGRDGDSFGGPQVNVFIDGVSLKSNVNQGGIVGQDVSRGNPFSQLAVREFRVLTSNFKAEFEDAGTAIITAVTKSGTNTLRGEVFGSYQNEKMINRDFFVKRDDLEEPELERKQYGAGLGGPIIPDKLFFFASYEANLQDRALTVIPGGSPAEQALVPFDVDQFRGSFGSPFREHLGFGKLTFQAAEDHLVELSASIRKETDLRGFGGSEARERGEDVDNNVYTAKLRYDWRGDGFLNEATIDWLKSDLQFGALGSAGFGRIYQGVISVGGRPQFQEVLQKGLTFRNNFSFTDLEWHGRHLVKLGAKLSLQKYGVGGTGPNANPQFEFVRNDRGTPDDTSDDLDFTFPAVVRFGGGNPEVKAKTTQIGLFVQDDWEVNEHLIVNAGLRWDYDSNAKNNSFRTPDRAVAALRALGTDPRIGSYFDVEDYISNGNRKADKNNFAPRIGFSYDLNADQRTVFFGGYGRYYDRALFRSAAEETLFAQFRSGELLFSRDGLPRDGRPTIQFQDAYLTQQGFDALLASLAADPTSPGTNQLRAIPNDLKTPYTDQFSIGVRQRLGIFRTSLTFNHTVGKDQIGYAPLNRSAEPGTNGFFDFIPLINGYGDAVAAFNTRATKYDAIFLSVDKPYTKASGWGVGLAYTGVLRAKERGTAFNFDYPNIGDQPFVPGAGNEKHRAVLNGVADLPFDFRVSGLVTYGSGLPFFVVDARDGFQPGNIRLGYFEELPHFLQVDLRLQKIFRMWGDKELSISAEVFNLLNRANFGSADGFICCDGNPNFGKPNGLAGPPRSFQLGAAFRF